MNYPQYQDLHSDALFSKLIVCKRWSLLAKQVNRQGYLYSNQNFAVQLVIEAFKPLYHEKAGRYTHRKIFEDKEIRTLISSRRFD
jgi:hypothetical protein